MPKNFFVIEAEGFKFWDIGSTCGSLSAAIALYFLQASFKIFKKCYSTGSFQRNDFLKT